MKNAVDLATKNFCADTLGLQVESAKYLGDKLYGSAIALYENDKEYQWYLLFKKDTLNEFAKILLFEDSLNEDDLDDLVKEVSNIIIGSAKVLLEEKNKECDYKIGVPDFLGHIDKHKILNLQEILLYKIKNRTFALGRRIDS